MDCGSARIADGDVTDRRKVETALANLLDLRVNGLHSAATDTDPDEADYRYRTTLPRDDTGGQ